MRAKPARQGGGDGKGEGFIFRTQPQARRGVASFPHTLERQAQTPRLKTLHPPVPVRTHLHSARSRRPPTTSTTTHARATYRVASRPRTRGARPRQSSRPRRTRSRHTSTSSNDENENAQPPMEVPHARATQRPHERSPSIMPQAQQPSPTEFAPTQQARPNIDDDVLLRQHAGSGLRQQPTERGASGGPCGRSRRGRVVGMERVRVSSSGRSHRRG